MKIAFGAAMALALSAAAAGARSFEETFPGHPGYDIEEVDQILRGLDYKTGHIDLPGGQAQLEVPEGYYYLDPGDTTAVLSDLWGNPPDTSLGMIFPSAYTPWDDDTWGAELDFDPMGYVSDDDAESYDYDDLLKEMQAETRADSGERVRAGYDSVELIGWAAPPSYDRTQRKLHWALELKFGEGEEHTLNYKLRALGREGVLNANFIGSMAQLGTIQRSLPEVAQMISFTEGKTYADFDPSLDKVAAVGVAGLIAGKVLTSKAGFLAVALLLLKKGWFVLLLPFIWLKRLFNRN